MRIRRWCTGAIAAALLQVGGCAGSSAPQGWLTSARDVGRTATGGWIEVSYLDLEMRQANTMGEFLGFRGDELCVLTEAGVTTVPTRRVEGARLRGYAPAHEGMIAWTVLGSLSSLSHGFFLAISLPVWITCGSLATASQSRQGIVDYRPGKNAIGELAPYARFPAGVPESIDLSAWQLHGDVTNAPEVDARAEAPSAVSRDADRPATPAKEINAGRRP